MRQQVAAATNSMALLAATACGDVTGIRIPLPVPVVQVLLVSGKSVQEAQIEYSAPADSVVARKPRPISPDSVSLMLTGPDSVPAPFSPKAGSPGRFIALHSIVPGVRYRLSGSVAGHAVSGAVTVPGALLVREPAADTLRLSASLPTQQVRFAASSFGARAYIVRGRRRSGPDSFEAIRDTAGFFHPMPLYANRADTVHLSFEAYDVHAAEAFLPFTSIGNLHGVLGAIGASVRASHSVILVWQ